MRFAKGERWSRLNMQKEDGAVRLPPQGWRIDTKAIVPYEVDKATGRVTNWRKVRDGIEASFLATGLPRESYNAAELREMSFLP